MRKVLNAVVPLCVVVAVIAIAAWVLVRAGS